jgi:hypothetical protein
LIYIAKVVARQKILGLDEESQKRKSIQEAEIDPRQVRESFGEQPLLRCRSIPALHIESKLSSRSCRTIWIQYAKLELIYIAKVVARQKILGLDEESQKRKVYFSVRSSARVDVLSCE